MITKVYHTHTTDDGYIFDVRPMPEHQSGTHGAPITGTPVRLLLLIQMKKENLQLFLTSMVYFYQMRANRDILASMITK